MLQSLRRVCAGRTGPDQRTSDHRDTSGSFFPAHSVDDDGSKQRRARRAAVVLVLSFRTTTAIDRTRASNATASTVHANCIGPNAIIQTAVVLHARFGTARATTMLAHATGRALDGMPTQMVDEGEVRALVHTCLSTLRHRQTQAVLREAVLREAMLREAGQRTADCLLADRTWRRWRAPVVAVRRTGIWYAGRSGAQDRSGVHPCIPMRYGASTKLLLPRQRDQPTEQLTHGVGR